MLLIKCFLYPSNRAGVQGGKQTSLKHSVSYRICFSTFPNYTKIAFILDSGQLNYSSNHSMCIYRLKISLQSFWFIAICDLLEDRCINDVTVNFFTSLLFKTNRFHVSMHLFMNSEDVKMWQEHETHSSTGSCATFLFLTHNLWSITEQIKGNMESIC